MSWSDHPLNVAHQGLLVYPKAMQEPISKVSLSPAPRRKLTETVAEQLLSAIRELPPGTKVPSERELTKELGVGRSTVREALNGLAMLGIVEIRHGQGVFVTGEPAPINEPSAITAALERGVTHEFIEARLIVEVEVARLAARRRTDEDLARLSAALEVQESRLRGDIDALVDVAASFNVLLAAAAHNEVLGAMIQSFVSLMVERGPRIYSLEGFGEWDLKEHRGLFEAVRDRDADLAAERMRVHIEELARRYRVVGAA
jgi:GntR family transcriptional repressor for pyruvate dehydrogenase complex